MDPHEPEVDKISFNSYAYWKDFYGDMVKENPPNIPEPLGKPVTITSFVDADHTSNLVTRISNTGILLL